MQLLFPSAFNLSPRQ